MKSTKKPKVNYSSKGYLLTEDGEFAPFNLHNMVLSLEQRMDKSLVLLDKNRHLIDKRIDNITIMTLYDMNIDAVSFCAERVRKYDELNK